MAAILAAAGDDAASGVRVLHRKGRLSLPTSPTSPEAAAAACQLCSGTGYVRGRAVRPVTFS